MGNRGREAEGTMMAEVMGHLSLCQTGIVWMIKGREVKIKKKGITVILKSPFLVTHAI